MMYVFILLLILPSMIGYAGCTSDQNHPSQQQAELIQQKSSGSISDDSSQVKEVPETPVTIAKTVPVHYPEEARKKGIQGEVQIQILVGADGLVKEATVISNETGSKELEKAALEAVHKWTFNPSKLEGKPIQAYVIIPIKFKLQEKSK